MNRRNRTFEEHDVADPSWDPIFIVGCQRSGTTALAVMLDRHSRIAVPAETHFLYQFMFHDAHRYGVGTHSEMVDRAMANRAIRAVGVTAEEVMEQFRTNDNSYPCLMKSILEAYRLQQGKLRVAEKSCNHLFYTEDILKFFPGARIICIIRDGRDVVLSLKNVPWATHLPCQVLCHKWVNYIDEAMRCKRVLPAESFTTVKYEDLMIYPDRELKRLCEFIGEEFEPEQLEETVQAGPVQEREFAWKSKARMRPDPSRAEAWRRCDDPRLISKLNYYMGDALRHVGYADTKVEGVGGLRRTMWRISDLPFRPGIYNLTLKVNRARRRLLSFFTGKREERSYS
jgi:hypothetical protein